MFWRGLWGFTVIGVFMISSYVRLPLALATERFRITFQRVGPFRPDSSLSR
jgi:hypothetical protein